MAQLTLYNYFRSSASYRVRLALEFKKMKYDYKAVHLLKEGGQQHSQEFLKLNPMGEVPCLVHKLNAHAEPIVISQSMAICFYLDEIDQSAPQLFPDTPELRARVFQICENINASIHPLTNLKVLNALTERFAATAAQREEWIRNWIVKGFTGIEKLLIQTAGTSCFADQVTAADCFLVPQIFNARRFKVDMAPFPTLQKIEAFLTAQDWAQKAHPARQIDSET